MYTFHYFLIISFNYMKSYPIFLFAILLFSSLFAQKEGIEFNQTKHDFGTLYKGGPTEHTFEFTNISGKPVKLQSVKASCGCTTPNWSQDEVAPGAKGSIATKYDSQRVGQFNKTITVVYDTAQKPIVLTIMGNILDTTAEAQHKHAAIPKIQYDFPQGNISFERKSEFVGPVDTDKKKAISFRMRNMGKESITFQKPAASDTDPVFGNFVFAPSTLQAGQEGVMEVVLDASKYTEKGGFTKKLIIPTNDSEVPNKELEVIGEFVRVLTPEEKLRVPKIVFDATEYDAKTALEGEKVVHKFTFTNAGKEDLIIESAKGSCGCTVAEPKLPLRLTLLAEQEQMSKPLL
jgi:hypothetical protein